jgi:hypothetical protein
VIELHDLYDDETLARIDGYPPHPPRPTTGRARHTGVAMAVMAGIALGLREVLEPPRRSEIDTVDPWEDDDRGQRGIRFHWHPQPACSVVELPA